MNNAIDKIKKAFEENPLAVIVVGSLAVTAAAKLMDANTNRVSAKTHAREVDRRIRKL